jgi:hypothetical protein
VGAQDDARDQPDRAEHLQGKVSKPAARPAASPAHSGSARTILACLKKPQRKPVPARLRRVPTAYRKANGMVAPMKRRIAATIEMTRPATVPANEGGAAEVPRQFLKRWARWLFHAATDRRQSWGIGGSKK